MPRTPIPFAVDDMSALARSLRDQAVRLGRTPSHLEMLNMLARAAGRRNYQHYQAERGEGSGGQAGPTASPPAEPGPDLVHVERAARQFDPQGRLIQWPTRTKVLDLCLWVLWSRVPAGRVFTEREISALLTQWHLFGDPAVLRRAMFEAKLLDRTPDVREYRRVERRPPPELSLLRARIERTSG